jgi:hypothetical protein
MQVLLGLFWRVSHLNIFYEMTNIYLTLQATCKIKYTAREFYGIVFLKNSLAGFDTSINAHLLIDNLFFN